MAAIALNEVSAGDIVQAQETMAHLTVYELSNPASSEEHRKMVLGNYLLCCVMVRDVTAGDGFIEGLRAAGATSEVSERLAETMMAKPVERYVLSLNHIPAEQTGFGIERSRNGRTLNSASFIRAVLELDGRS
jgi:hypothetical protein